MLMTFEGWQFTLEIYDTSEEIGDDTIDKSGVLVRRDSPTGRNHASFARGEDVAE